MKKIKITKGVCCNPWNMSAIVGDEIEVDDKQADELVKAGRAEILESVEEAPKKKKKAE